MNSRTAQYLTLAGLTLVTVASVTHVWAQSIASQYQAEPVLIAQARPALAQELQGKPVVAYIYASWCPACKNVSPTLSQVKQQYGGSVNFVTFDVSDRGSTKSAQTRAKQLGLDAFFQANKSQTSLVAIIDPKTGKTIKEFRNNNQIKDYQSALTQAIQKIKK
jgi:thiol-disulfide isomerase/thioredoxin